MYSMFIVTSKTHTVSENGCTWDFMAAVIKSKSITFQLMICKFLDCIGSHANDLQVKYKWNT